MKSKMSHKNCAKKKNYCKICDKIVLGSSFNFKSHLYVHNSVKHRYQCEFCLKRYFRYDTYRLHLHSHKEEDTRKRYVCDYCDRGYLDKRNLITHLRIHDDSMARNLIRFSCEACGLDFCEKRVLQNHVRRVHLNTTDVKEPTHMKREVNDSWFEPVIQTDVCVQMTKINNNIISIKKCGKVKREDVKLKIDKRKSSKKQSLRSDNYTVYSKAICDYCNKEMLKKSIYNHIREKHFKVRNFKCDTCHRTFNRRYQLIDHVCGEVSRTRKKSTKNQGQTNKLKEQID